MKIFSILLVIVFTFILNIGLYYTSSNYRLFLKNIKEDNIVNNVNDNYNIDLEHTKDSKNKILEGELNKGLFKKDKSKIENNIEKVQFIEKKDNLPIKESIYFKELLQKLKSYKMVKLKSHSTLMDVTGEYPDKYFEYYSKDLSIYYFPTKKYNEVKEIFEVETDSGLFKLNELDNFGEESFYINLLEPYKDEFIRFIFSRNGSIIGIKVSRKEYNKIKNIIK